MSKLYSRKTPTNQPPRNRAAQTNVSAQSTSHDETVPDPPLSRVDWERRFRFSPNEAKLADKLKTIHHQDLRPVPRPNSSAIEPNVQANEDVRPLRSLPRSTARGESQKARERSHGDRPARWKGKRVGNLKKRANEATRIDPPDGRDAAVRLAGATAEP